jgi:hypothetical protein
MEYLHKKHFTFEQAKDIVPVVVPQIQELVSLKQKLDSRGFDIYKHQYFGGSGPNGERFFPIELERLVEIVKNLSKKGILIKSIDDGLIDLPYLRSNNQEVYLCWKFDESNIQYWHNVADGFSGRKPLKD